jgi:hypothetical protein
MKKTTRWVRLDVQAPVARAPLLVEVHHRTDLAQVRRGVRQAEVRDTEGLAVRAETADKGA